MLYVLAGILLVGIGYGLYASLFRNSKEEDLKPQSFLWRQ